MLRNYIITTLRGMRRSKVFTLINLLGLSVAMACFILVGLYVRYELSYDQFHEDVEDIYLVKLKFTEEMGGSYNQLLPAVFADVIKEGTPGLEEVTTTLAGADNMYVVKGEEYILEKYYTFQNSFFDVFTFPFLYGNKATALTEPQSVVISKEMALKYFNKENAVGETLSVDGKGDFKVTGVLKSFPQNSQFQPHFSFSLNNMSNLDSWGYNTFFIYIKTLPNTDLTEVQNRIASLYNANKPEGAMYEGGGLGSFAESYWQLSRSGASLNNRDRGLGADKDVIYMCSGLAVLLLFIALANYVNMATAKAIQRAKEVGVRKVNGASRKQLIYQFLGETLIFSLLCLIVSVILVEVFIPSVSEMIGIQLSMDFGEPAILLFLVGYAILCGLSAGIYPAILLSRFNPVKALKGQAQVSQSGFSHRNILLFLQFTISAFMIMVLLVANSQIKHYINFDLGFDKERVVSIGLTEEMREKPQVVMQEVRIIIGVEGVTVGPMPGGAFGFNTIEYGEKKLKYVPRVESDENFLPMLKIPLLAGRNFDPKMVSDQENAMIVNETLAKELELEDPVGAVILFEGKQKTIIGLMKDFYISGPRARKRSLMLTPLISGNVNNLLVKVNAENMASTLGQIDKLWDQFDYKNAYQYRFLDNAYEEKLSQIQRITSIINGVTTAIVVISLFGLFSLVAFQTSRRVKEIGIRKVLGARGINILLILGKPYAWLILLSSAVAIPLGYSLMDKTLEQYTNRIELDASFALITILAIVVFSVLVIVSRAISAVRANPVDILRNE
jgi:putative ABC transport system permease protein